MLKNFVARGIPVLGVDPVPGPAAAARNAGVPTREEFFTRDSAARLAGEGYRADVVLGNNVLAHVADLPGFVDGIASVLKEDGVAVIECPYVRDLIEHCEFDTIYHEHLCYFSVTAAAALFSSRGLSLNDVRRLPTHGGSLRLYVGHHAAPSQAVRELIEEERRIGLDAESYYAKFAGRVHAVQQELGSLLRTLKEQGKRVAGYAAAAKGTILLNAAGIGTSLVDYIVDRNEFKQGKYMPGVRIPISETQRLVHERPDYLLVLAWNFKEEIMSQQRAYREAGGKFIVPIPWPVVA
jgi:SAM-dependent methyltransferase